MLKKPRFCSVIIMAFNKPPTRANKVVGQDSPKNTVKIAQLEKSKEPREPEIRSFLDRQEIVRVKVRVW